MGWGGGGGGVEVGGDGEEGGGRGLGLFPSTTKISRADCVVIWKEKNIKCHFCH